MSGSGCEQGERWRNFYGRRHGKKLRPGQQRLLETRLDALALPGLGPGEAGERCLIDPAALFPDKSDLWLEIGFGGGEHMIHQALETPGIGMIGCEPYINGVAKLLAAIERSGADNLRIHARDARDLMDVLPDASVGRVFLLYPDPWPKRRHWKRRFIGPDNLAMLARVMRPGAELRLATDIADYVRHSLEQIRREPRFAWTAERPSDWRMPWPGWPGTRYEAKALAEGRTPHYLTFRRV